MSRSAKEREEALRRWQATPVHLTPEGLERLKSKLEHLKTILPGLAEEAARTAAYGDRSENVEYVEAKRRLRGTQNQIYRIEDELKKVIVIASGPAADGKIRIGATVVVEAKDGVKKTYRIVGPKETDPAKGFISHVSPLGAALIGRKAGRTVELETAAGKRTYKIVEVK